MRSRRAGRRAGQLVAVIPEVGRFELASPRATPWPTLLDGVRALLDGNVAGLPGGAP